MAVDDSALFQTIWTQQGKIKPSQYLSNWNYYVDNISFSAINYYECQS